MVTIVALMVIGCLVIAALMLAFGYPQIYTNLVKLILKPFKKIFKNRPGKEALAKPHKATPTEILAGKIEQLTAGKTLSYKIAEPEAWGCNFISVELNSQYPQKGKKYLFSREKMANGMPDGNKCNIYDSDDAMQIANSIIERKGIPFATAEELLASAGVGMAKDKKEAAVTSKK
jgi:hypothetical protein